MKKTICVMLLFFAVGGLLTGIPELADGVRARGWGGVNYGRVFFPLLVGGVCAYTLYHERKKPESSGSDASAPKR